jgi:hypothetical protein
LKTGQFVELKFKEDDRIKEATVISRPGKSSGKYKNWYNIGFTNVNGEVETRSVNIEELERLEPNRIEIQGEQHSNPSR